MLLALFLNCMNCYSEEITIAFSHENYNFVKLFERFSAQTGVKVTTAAFGSEDLKVELLQRAGDNNLPDVVIVPADYIGLEEIRYSEIPESLNFKNTDKTLIESLKIDGKQFGIPIIAGNHLVLYFNKNHIRQPGTSWETLLKQKNDLSPGTSLIGWSYNEMYWFLPFLTAFGEPPLIGHMINLDSPNMREAISFYWAFSQQNVIDESCDYQCTVDKFTQGKLAYMINGVWAHSLLEDVLKDDLGIALLPKVNGQVMRPYFSAHVMAFPNQSLTAKKSAILRKLASFFQSDETQWQIWNEMQSLPVNRIVHNEVFAQATDNEKAIFKQLEQSLPMPTTREMAIVWAAMGKGVSRFRAGILDLERVGEYMQYIADKSVKEIEQE